MRRALDIGLLALVAAGLLACGGPPPYRMDTPEKFRKFEKSDDFKFITADGVLLKGREVDNYPKADLPFWTDALRRHMEQRGYAFKSEDCFQTARALDGCTLDFLLPHGAEDWVLSETLYVVGDRIVLLEAAGPFERFAPVEAHLRAAYRSFDPKPGK